MGTEPMGHARAEVIVENQGDLWNLARGLIDPEAVQSQHLPSAIVDPNAVFLSLPTSLFNSLGLSRSPLARITILGRTCTMDVQEASESSSATIGRLVLACLDLVIDPKGLTLVGNPAQGGEWILEQYNHSVEFASPMAGMAPFPSEPIA